MSQSTFFSHDGTELLTSTQGNNNQGVHNFGKAKFPDFFPDSNQISLTHVCVFCTCNCLVSWEAEDAIPYFFLCKE